MAYALRPAQRADSSFLFKLHELALKQYVEPLFGWEDKLQRALHSRWFKPELVKIVVVRGQDAGVLDVDAHERELYIARIELLPEFQRQGIGTQLLRDLLRAARDQNRSVALHVFKNNPARRLYQRLGFAAVKEEAHRLLMRLYPGGSAD